MVVASVIMTFSEWNIAIKFAFDPKLFDCSPGPAQLMGVTRGDGRKQRMQFWGHKNFKSPVTSNQRGALNWFLTWLWEWKINTKKMNQLWKQILKCTIKIRPFAARILKLIDSFLMKMLFTVTSIEITILLNKEWAI